MKHRVIPPLGLALAAVLSCTLPLRQSAAEPTIQAPASVPAGSMFIVRIEGIDKDAKFSWHVPGGGAILADLLDRATLSPVLLVQPQAGRTGTLYLVLAYLGEDGAPKQVSSATQIGTTPPAPDPVPPGPTPVPVPPNPEGFRVLILEETADRPSLPRGQLAVLMSPEVRTYLNAKDADCWRLLDDDLTAQHMTGWTDGWKAAYAKAKELSAGRLPFIVVTNSTSGEAKPLPATVEETLTLLRKYGG